MPDLKPLPLVPTAAQRWMKVKYNGDEIDCGTTMIEKKYYKSC